MEVQIAKPIAFHIFAFFFQPNFLKKFQKTAFTKVGIRFSKFQFESF